MMLVTKYKTTKTSNGDSAKSPFFILSIADVLSVYSVTPFLKMAISR